MEKDGRPSAGADRCDDIMGCLCLTSTSDEAEEASGGRGAHLCQREFLRTTLGRATEWKQYIPSDFEMISVNMARGATCKIHLVKHCQSKFVGVMKVLDSMKGHVASTELRMAVMTSQSPLLLTVLQGYRSPTGYHLLLQYAPFSTLDRLTSQCGGLGGRAGFYVAELAAAISFLHHRHVLHRDIKPDNAFITSSGHVALGDFGSVHRLQDSGPLEGGLCGSYLTRPPEVWIGERYSYEVDIWEFGVTIYNLICNKWPWCSAHKDKQVAMVTRGQLTFPGVEGFTPAARGLIAQMLSTHPTSRPAIDDVMSHVYLHPPPEGPPYTPRDLITILNIQGEELTRTAQLIGLDDEM